MIAERGAAIAQPRSEAFGDQRRLRAVHHVVRDKGQHDREKNQPGDHAVHHREIDEGECPDGDRADEVHPFAADAI
jgi:hypothetical protein